MADNLLIETERLLIRPMRPEDAEELHAVYADPVAMRCIPSGVSDSLEATRGRVARFAEHQATHGFSLWAVVEKAGGRVVGDCGLLLVEWRGPDVEVAYRFRRSAWGHGYATEAARACVRFGLDVLGLDRVIAVTDPDHHASRRVMEKIGLTYRGMACLFGRDLVLYATSGPPDDGPDRP
jgi:RimJ/RimL family protein N-acetyltransferase